MTHCYSIQRLGGSTPVAAAAPQEASLVGEQHSRTQDMSPSPPPTATSTCACPSETHKPDARLSKWELICANDCNYFIIRRPGTCVCEISIYVQNRGLITSWIKRNLDPGLKTDVQLLHVPMVALWASGIGFSACKTSPPPHCFAKYSLKKKYKGLHC